MTPEKRFTEVNVRRVFAGAETCDLAAFDLAPFCKGWGPDQNVPFFDPHNLSTLLKFYSNVILYKITLLFSFVSLGTGGEGGMGVLRNLPFF